VPKLTRAQADECAALPSWDEMTEQQRQEADRVHAEVNIGALITGMRRPGLTVGRVSSTGAVSVADCASTVVICNPAS
jgi:hypothetical protein